MRLALGRLQNKEADSEGANPTHGSVWIVQAQPTKRAAGRLWFYYFSSLAARGKRNNKNKTGIPSAPLCRLGLNYPPTSVGGIRARISYVRPLLITTTRNISHGFACLALALFLSHGAAASQARIANHDTHSIEDPSNQAMLGFYQSLARAFQGEWVTRIIHYGDSHVAADILTGELRRQLQLCFGEAGAGFVLPGRPWPGYSRPGVTSQASAGWQTDGLTRASLAA